MDDRRRKIDESDPFGLMDRMAGATQPRKEIVEVPVEVEVYVEVPRPVGTDEEGVTWVGNIGMSPTGLRLPDNLSQNEWFDFFQVIKNVRQSLQYIIGDWFAYGTDNFKYTYEQIAALTGYKESTVETYASVCRNVPQLTRINSPHFNYSKVVAPLKPHEQIQALNIAQENSMSARQLHAYIQGEKPARLRRKNDRRKSYNVVDKVEFNRLRKATPEQRSKVAQQLRELADQLERGE